MGGRTLQLDGGAGCIYPRSDVPAYMRLYFTFLYYYIRIFYGYDIGF